MKPLRLLPKYLLITVAVCAAAVVVTGLTLYLAFRSSVDTTLSAERPRLPGATCRNG